MMYGLNRAAVMGILNVTPDSFFDGGQYAATEAAIRRALQMLAEGADIIDIGGESTGPGSSAVTREEELHRILPVIRGILREKPDAFLSIDTYKAEVARAALRAGARMINDMSAGRADPAMFPLIAGAECRHVMMRSKDTTPRTTVAPVAYEDVMCTIHAFFEERLAAAERAGIPRDRILLDPGLGHFVSSDPRYSWEILERLRELQDFDCGILVSPSRKSFTAVAWASAHAPLAMHGLKPVSPPPAERLMGTLEATRIALAHGAAIIRTHDVEETRKTIEESCREKCLAPESLTPD